MRILLTTAFAIFSLAAVSQSSISNTKWKGKILAPRGDVRVVTFDFGSDTFYIYRNGTELLSTFAFFQSHDTLTVHKTGGSGPCPASAKGIYRLEMLENGEKFHFRLINEECKGRGNGWTYSAFERIH